MQEKARTKQETSQEDIVHRGFKDLIPLEKKRLTPLEKTKTRLYWGNKPKRRQRQSIGNNPKGQGSNPLGTTQKDEQKTQLKPGTNPERRKIIHWE